MSTDTNTIDLADPAFARNLARLLIAARSRRNVNLRQLARASHGRFTQAKLMQIESAACELSDDVIADVTRLYLADLGRILPERNPIRIDHRSISSDGVEVGFDPADDQSLLRAYLELVRRMRDGRRPIEATLRRHDIELLAEHLHVDTSEVIERLGTLMGAPRPQRSSMLGLFGNGAVVIGFAGYRFS
jgi:hypothetical protein